MGLFKAMKDMVGVTKQGMALQEQQQQQAGYKPGMGGMVSQMGDMLGEMNVQLQELAEQSGDQQRLLTQGIPADAVIVGMGTPARGAQQFNLDLDLEVHMTGRAPYRVANQYIVPAWAPLTPGGHLPVRVDPSDPAKLAIDWQNVSQSPGRGEVRPVDSPAAPGGDDPLVKLEKLAKLRDSGVLTQAEFDEQKRRLLGELT
jgi:hypothetical protein